MSDGSARPTGVTILAVIWAIFGVFGLLGSLAAIGLGTFLTVVSPAVGGMAVIAGIIGIALSVLELVLAYGFWALKPWAWPVAVAALALSVVNALLGAVGGNIVGLVIGLVVAGVVLWYLHQTHVRAAFGAPASGFPVVGNAFDRYIPGPRT